MRLFAFIAIVFMATMSFARAEGNFAAQPIDLEPLQMDSALNFSVTEYQIETGKYYRWEIGSDGGEEFLVKAPELWRNAWINQVVINDIEVKPLGGIEGVEFDDEGSAVIWFVVLRPGEYPFYAAGYEERGMMGKFVVR
jgi:hypothetical protein